MPSSDHRDVPLADYSRALDEIYRLRTALAIEARATQAHLNFKTFPKSQRPYAERQIARMQAAARGDVEQAYDVELTGWQGKACLREAGAAETLTRWQWEQESLATRPSASEA